MCETILRRWLSEAANSPCWCDVTIFAGGRKYRAHRIVLSSASPFIRRLLLSRPSEDVPMTIVLADVTADTVEALLQYIYNGEVTLLPEQLNEFLNLSEQLMIYIDENDIKRMREMTYDIESKNINKLPVNLTMDNSTNCHQAKFIDKIVNKNTQTYCHKKLALDKLKYLSQKVYQLKEHCDDKNLDLEIFIKSDKISKNNSIYLPVASTNSINIKNTDILQYEELKNSILKNALGHNNTNEEMLANLNRLKNDPLFARNFQKTLLDANVCKAESLREYPANFCSTFPYLAPTIVENLRSTSFKSERKDACDDDIFSDSSCEILEDANESNKKEPDKNKRNLSTNENKYNSNDIFKTTIHSNEQRCRQEAEVLNLVYNTKQNTSTQSLGYNHINKLYNYSEYAYSERDVNNSQLIRNRHCANQLQRNDKLVRPIPSLMPIDMFTSILDLTPDKRRKSKDSYEIIENKNRILKHTSNSAFDQVNSNAPNEYACRSQSAISATSIVNQTKDCDYFQNSLNVKESLRYGFKQTVSEKISQTSLNTHVKTKHNSYSNESSRFPIKNISADENIIRVKKKMLYNKVLECPWNMRGPVLYCHGNNSFKRSNKHEDTQSKIFLHKKTNILYGNSQSSESATIKLKRDSNVNDVCNDSNNNFAEKIEHQTINETKKYVESEIMNSEMLKSAESIRNVNQELKNILERNISNDESVKILKPENCVDNLQIKIDLPDINVCTSKSPLKCEVCTKVFTSASALELHLASHSSRARYRCDQCDKCFSQLRNYKYHVSVHKGTKEFAATCNVCGKYFNDRGYLSSHMKIHRNRKEYQCPHCPKSFNQRVAYNMHVRIHTGVKPHQCEACGKAFSRKMLLKQHARTHSGEKPYACSACGKRFADRSNMTLHMRLHSGVKPFSCTLCPKSFTKKHHLKTHLNYHTGNKPYACGKCSLTFSQSSNMRTHMKKCSSTSPP